MDQPTPMAPPLKWRLEKQAGPEYAPKSRSRGPRIFLAVAGVLGLVGLLAGLLSWLTPLPRGVLLALYVQECQDPALPIPNQGRLDQEALLQMPMFAVVPPLASATPQRHLLSRELGFLKDLPARETVVVYLSAPAFCDGSGRIMVMAGNSEAQTPGTWLRLESVLRQIAGYQARHKLVVLDLMRPMAGTLPNLIRDDVAGAVEQELEAVPDPGRLTLAACAPGQVSLASQVAGRSIFSMYLEQGLRGAADGYGAHGTRDSRIMVSELAAFLQARVARWARVNRGQPQRPVLYGEVEQNDFSVAAVDMHAPPYEAVIPAATKYPAWLKEAWKQRDQALMDGRWRLTPRTFARQQAWLLKAELDWRGGLDEGTLQSVDQAQLQALKDNAEKTRQFAAPEPHSLALAMSLAPGDREDREAFKAVQDLFARLKVLKTADPGRAKLLEEFTEKFARIPPLARQMAVFQQAAAENEPTRERIELLYQLQGIPPDERPRFVEGLLLKRLAEWSARPEGKSWPTESARRLLLATAKGEAAASGYEVYSWNAALLSEADQLRHDGEVLFWSPGYAPLADVDELLSRATGLYNQILQRTEVLLEARRVLDAAFLHLPAYAPYLGSAPAMRVPWTQAVESAEALDRMLNGPAPAGLIGARPIDTIPEVTDLLRRQMETLRQPFNAEVVAALVRRSKLAAADVGVIHEIQVILATPFCKSDERAALWEASFDLETRLHKLTIRQDMEEDESHEQTPVAESGSTGAEDDAASTEVRAASAIHLLRWMGLADAELEPIQKEFQRCAARRFEAGATHKLADLLRVAWSKQIEALLQADLPLAALDRISRLLPMLEVYRPLEDLALSLPTQARLSEAQGLWKHLGARLRYQSRDYQGAGLDWSPLSSGERFYGQAALAYLPRATAWRALDMIAVTGFPRLSSGRPQAEATLAFSWTTHKDEGPTIDVRLRSGNPGWLALDPALSRVQGTAANPAVPLALEGSLKLEARLLVASDAQPGPAPRGFMVEADLKGHHYHFKAPVPIKTGPDQPHLILSSNRKAPNPALQEVRLRAGKARTSVYLFACNPSDVPRKVAIEIKAGEASIKGGTITKVLPPQSTQRLDLAEAMALPVTELPEFSGPLQWRVVDADRPNDVLDEQAIPVVIGSPRDYVRVTNISYKPATPKSRSAALALTAQVYASPGGGDIPIELVMPPDRIPGLESVNGGTFLGMIPAGTDPRGNEVELSADKIVLADGEEEDGVVYLNVDGYDRAFTFRVTFARSGEPATPRADFRPAVRFRVGRFARADAKFVLPIEVDNPPEGATLEFAVGELVGGQFKARTPPRVFGTAKRQRIGFSAQSPDSGLVFEGSIQDWTLPLDTTRLLGRHEFEARLLDSSGREVAKTVQTVIVDNSEPSGVQILDLPKVAKRGSKLTVRAVAKDEEVGIKDAVFFIGKLVDNKLPPNTPTFKARPTDKTRSTWEAEVLLPEDKKGPTEISVQFTNQVGLVAYGTGLLELVDYDPAKSGPGRIKGKVVLGNLDQPGLEVALRDAKGAEKARTKTRDDGSFVFQDVAPGRYSVYCRKQEAQRYGTANVTVGPNQTVEVTVNLMVRVTKQ